RRAQRFLGARKVLGGKRKRGVSPSDGLSRQEKSRGKMLTYSVEIMQHRDDGSPLSPPALQKMQQILGRVLIQGRERLIEQNDVGILQQQPREQSPLELTDGKFGDRPIDDSQQTDSRNCLMDTRGEPGRNLPDRAE